ncbi:MAG: L-threonylcarbamoyladenylate synthase [Chromatiales bacterium]
MTPTLEQAARVLRDGGLVAYPTEGVYGLGCDPMNESAVDRLLELKQRPRAKGLILIAAAPEQLEPFLAPLEPRLRERVLARWPGPVTWVVPAAPTTPEWVRGQHETIAVRVTAHPLAAALCRAAGMAIVSTSANLSGHEPARSAREVVEQLGGRIDCVLEGALGGLDRPTEILDARTGRVLRSG